MSAARAGRRGGTRAVAILAVLGALAIGCDSSDDDDGDDVGNPGTTDGGGTGGATAGGTGGTGDMTGGGMEAGDGTFAQILDRGPADEPVDVDAAALSADLEAIFGTAADGPVDVTGGDIRTGDEADGSADGRRRAAAR